MNKIKVGDRVKIFLNEKFGEHSGWYEGSVFKIEAYSQHRNFYWVELDNDAQASLNLKQISVLNPKNIEKIE